MKILILGNMGYVGPAVVDRLRSTYPQATLVGYDTGFFGHCVTNVDHLPERKLDCQYFGDIRSNIPDELLKGTDAIVNLAAISNDPMSFKFESVTLDVNHKSGIAVAKKAKAFGVKSFVFASSCSMYGEATDAPKKEDSSLNPLTAYARSKVLTEQDLKPLADKNFKVTCLRFATACGMSPRLRLDLVLNDFVACALLFKKITILSDGTPWRPLINIKDMARAIDWAICRPESIGEFLAINTGTTSWNYQVKDLAEAVSSVVPGVEVSINPDAPVDKRSYRVDFSLFEKLAPNHQPKHDLISTVKEVKEGLEQMNFNDVNFRNSSLIRLKVITNLQDKGKISNNLEWIA